LFSKVANNKNRIVINNEVNNKEKKNWFTIPAISYKFKNITKDFKGNLAFFSLNKLRYIVKGHKDILPKSSQKNVVFKLSCKDCNATDVTLRNGYMSDRHVGN